ncbi:s-acyltransferase [Anaeramoeba flamelloides]|uniref:Palmitoyltransferase n=1 Tax=Anaeramoeba flamelloides TaxID=1746091 RepID=A0AAV7YXG4_9EUKA|nr:s-acyltransferase [Anaeramoeba flamelloides]
MKQAHKKQVGLTTLISKQNRLISFFTLPKDLTFFLFFTKTMKNMVLHTNSEMVNLVYPLDLEDNSDLSNTYFYKYVPGNNFVCCRGKITTGPDLHIFTRSFIVYNFPLLYFFFTVGKNLLTVSKSILVLGIVIAISTNACFFLTAFVNPGIIRRFPKKVLLDQEGYPQANPKKKKTKKVEFRDYIFQLNYCKSCQIYRPPRASHCRKCNNCILKFDHHCKISFVGSDIGLRNYRFFALFLMFNMLTIIYLTIFCIWGIVVRFKKIYSENNNGDNPLSKSLGNSINEMILLIVAIIGFLFLRALFSFHIFLISKNLTTREYLKSILDDANPYDLGCLNNWKETFFSKIPKLPFKYSDHPTENELIQLKKCVKNKPREKQLYKKYLLEKKNKKNQIHHNSIQKEATKNKQNQRLISNNNLEGMYTNDDNNLNEKHPPSENSTTSITTESKK